MRNRSVLADCHPAAGFLYFALVLAFGMTLMHPACLLISLVGSAACAVRLGGRRGSAFALRAALPLLLLAAAVNPLFSHAGRTILFYLPGGSPFTLESVLYGAASGCMLASVLLWFHAYNAVMTSDKFICLFGRVIPSLSLLLSMILRFVPRFRVQLEAIREAQRCLGQDADAGSVRRRIRNAVRIVSIMVGWALENAVETADSMRSRGYGLPGRSAFSVYRFDGRDRALLGWLLFCGGYLLCGSAAGGLYWQYVPVLRGGVVSPLSVSFLLVYLALCLTPVILDRKEERKWKSLRCGISASPTPDRPAGRWTA